MTAFSKGRRRGFGTPQFALHLCLLVTAILVTVGGKLIEFYYPRPKPPNLQSLELLFWLYLLNLVVGFAGGVLVTYIIFRPPDSKQDKQDVTEDRDGGDSN